MSKFEEQNIDRVESTDMYQTMFNECNKSEAQLCQETRCLTESPVRPPPQNFSTTVQPSPAQLKSPDQSSKLLGLLITQSPPSLIYALPPVSSTPPKPPDRSVAAANSDVNFNSIVDADSNFVVLLKLVCPEVLSDTTSNHYSCLLQAPPPTSVQSYGMKWKHRLCFNQLIIIKRNKVMGGIWSRSILSHNSCSISLRACNSCVNCSIWAIT